MGALGVKVGEGGAVDGGEIGADGVGEDAVGLPAGMRDLVLGGGAAGSFGVAPVVLGDEVFNGVGEDGLEGWGGFDGEGVPVSGVLPLVADAEDLRGAGDGVAGGAGGVGLFVEGVGDEGDGAAGDELADEDNAAFACAIGLCAADVEAEVDLFELSVEGDGDAQDADAGEEEADKRDEAMTFKEVKLYTGGGARGRGWRGLRCTAP